MHGLVLEVHEEAVISPGIVDAAAHLSEWLDKSSSRSFEGFASATQAAAAGGVTTVIDLPAHSRPLATTAAKLQRKIEATRGRLHVDVGFWGAVQPDNVDLRTLGELLSHGALGLVAVVASSASAEQLGVPKGTRALTLTELEVAIDAATRVRKPVLVHAEIVSDDDAGLPAGKDGMDYASWMATRPRVWEEGAARALISYATKPRRADSPPPRLHVLRLTDAGCTPLLSSAASSLGTAQTPEGESVPRVTASTCPHYTMFDAESVVRGDTRLKCAPPLRNAANRLQLWKSLMDGSLSMLTSDHTPAPLDERAGSFFDAFSGISSLQFTLPATWTEGSLHGASLLNLSRWLSEEPAKLAGVWKHKGSIELGKDADLVIWRPDLRTETAAVFHRQPGSPYEDAPLFGRAMLTMLRGSVVFRDGMPPRATCGQPVMRPASAAAKVAAAAAAKSRREGHRPVRIDGRKS